MGTTSSVQHSRFSKAVENGGRLAHLATDEIKAAALWLNRSIINLTNKLPHPLNVICQDVYKASPYIAMTLLLPFPLYIAALIGVIGHKLLTTPAGQTASFRNFSNGTGMAVLYLGVKNIVSGSLGPSPITIVIGSAQVLSSIYTLLRTGFLFDVLKIPRPKNGFVSET
jgi:hypothetical protein